MPSGHVFYGYVPYGLVRTEHAPNGHCFMDMFCMDISPSDRFLKVTDMSHTVRFLMVLVGIFLVFTSGGWTLGPIVEGT